MTAKQEESFELVSDYINKLVYSNRQDLSLDQIIEEIKIGTTIGTNALLEKGARTALIVTKGFKDLLEIGHQNREFLFLLNIKKEKRFWENSFEVGGRMNSSEK